MDEGESFIKAILPGSYGGYLLFVYENGKRPRSSFRLMKRRPNRKKLIGAYSDKSPLAGIVHLKSDADVALYSSEVRALIFEQRYRRA
jgi:DNA gyrase subunit A